MRKKIQDAEKKKKTSIAKISKTITKFNEAAEQVGSLNVAIAGIQYDLDIYDTLVIKNEKNVDNVIRKMARAAAIFWSLGSMKTDVEEEKALAELEWDIWLNKKKSKIDGQKKYNSEQAKERYVIIKFGSIYRQKREELIFINKIHGRIRRAKNAVEKMCFMLQSIGAILREEMNTTPMAGK
jgi:hypothetical protein